MRDVLRSVTIAEEGRDTIESSPSPSSLNPFEEKGDKLSVALEVRRIVRTKSPNEDVVSALDLPLKGSTLSSLARRRRRSQHPMSASINSSATAVPAAIIAIDEVSLLPGESLEGMLETADVLAVGLVVKTGVAYFLSAVVSEVKEEDWDINGVGESVSDGEEEELGGNDSENDVRAKFIVRIERVIVSVGVNEEVFVV